MYVPKHTDIVMYTHVHMHMQLAQRGMLVFHFQPIYSTVCALKVIINAYKIF